MVKCIHNTETLLDISKEVGIEVNGEKTNYMFMSHEQNARQNHNIKIGNKSYERVEQFKYFATTIKNQNFIYKEIKEQFELGECLLPFIPQSFVCQFAIQKYNH